MEYVIIVTEHPSYWTEEGHHIAAIIGVSAVIDAFHSVHGFAAAYEEL
jgi:hypothetical protein